MGIHGWRGKRVSYGWMSTSLEYEWCCRGQGWWWWGGWISSMIAQTVHDVGLVMVRIYEVGGGGDLI